VLDRIRRILPDYITRDPAEVSEILSERLAGASVMTVYNYAYYTVTAVNANRTPQDTFELQDGSAPSLLDTSLLTLPMARCGSTRSFLVA